MIACPACGHKNAIGTRYCRSCGGKVEIKHEQLFNAVQEDQAILASKRWLDRGSSTLMVGLFFLVCGLVLRFAVVPPMPKADVPPIEVGSLVPATLPAPAPLPAAPEAAKKPVPAPAPAKKP